MIVTFVTGSLKGMANPAAVLDVGCGGGLFPRLLSENGYRAYGLDYSRQAAHVAWTHNAVPAVCGELPTAPFAPQSFTLLLIFISA